MRGIRGSSKSTSVQASSATILSAGTRTVGELESDEDLVLAGRFKGTIRTQRSVHVTPEAVVEGEIHAEQVLVLGRVDGAIHVRQRVEIQAGAVVVGEVTAPRIRVHEGVVLNATVRMSGPGAPRRHYLLPALLKTFENDSSEALEDAEQAAEIFLHSLGFEIETRPEHADKFGILRPIFRSYEPMQYRLLRERLSNVEQALQSAASAGAPADGGPDGPGQAPLQTTGASGARELAEALARLKSAALLVGPVEVTHFEANPGLDHLAVRMRRDSLPEETAGEALDPGHLLLSLQKLQGEMLRELDARDRPHG